MSLDNALLILEVNPVTDNATLAVEALRLATAAVTFAAALVGLSATTRKTSRNKTGAHPN